MLQVLITIKKDLESVTSILCKTLEITPFKRDYDSSFGEIANILKRYDINENPRNLRLRFTLFMQEFFDSIPENQWDLKDPKFIKQSEEFAIKKFKEWILEQVT
ncbi:MAG TPA: hypothetical protein VHH33_07035 [Nitrososphaeraceae archaeon]|jgi:hypothetical protein|nr:hypothetical protein [Nitrososphaeraceae archaeon]